MGRISNLSSLAPITDREMPFIHRAFDPEEVQRQFLACLNLPGRERLPDGGQSASVERRSFVRAIRLLRHKPGRRCLVEYELDDGYGGVFTVLGKIRAKGLDERTYRAVSELWNRGFGSGPPDGISIPEPVGTAPALNMWVQRKAPGVETTGLLSRSDSLHLARRIAEAAVKIHRTPAVTGRRHKMADELRILSDRIGRVAECHPDWSRRLSRILDGCDRLAASTPDSPERGIHRDFYPAQVLADGSDLYLLDFDLYCQGDPALDIGNFLAHVTESSLRKFGHPDIQLIWEKALTAEFLKRSPDVHPTTIETYKTLSLVRHIFISTQIPERRAHTELLLLLCERRLGLCEDCTAYS